MTDDLPEIFERVKPAAAPTALRPRVLSAVERELSRRHKPAWERALELGVAATLALGIGLNAWQFQHRGLIEPDPSAEPQRAQRSPLGDEQLIEFVNKRLAAQPPRRDPPAAFGEHYQELLQEIQEHPAG